MARVRPLRPASPSGSRPPGPLTAADVAAPPPRATRSRIELIRDGGRRLGQLLAGLVSFINPGMIVIGGGSWPGSGHMLLAEIRSVVYRRSLPLATGNLPIVLSELGAAGRRGRRGPDDLATRCSAS